MTPAILTAALAAWKCLAVSLVLRCPFDRRDPRLAPLRPDFSLRLQVEGGFVESPDPDLDERVARVRRIEDPPAAPRAKSAVVKACELSADLERFNGPLRVHRESAARFRPAVCAMAAPDMHGLAANEIPYVAAKASSSAEGVLHGRILRRELNASIVGGLGRLPSVTSRTLARRRIYVGCYRLAFIPDCPPTRISRPR